MGTQLRSQQAPGEEWHEAPPIGLNWSVLNAMIRAVVRVGPSAARLKLLRKASVRLVTACLHAEYKQALKISGRPPGTERERKDMAVVLLHTVERALAREQLSEATLHAILEALVQGALLTRRDDRSIKQHFHDMYGSDPPGFLLISPGKACNLVCTGCYADSSPTREKLDWVTFDRLVTEAHELWSARFFAISGGEPLAYRSDGKGVLDLAQRHRDCFFLMFTNGTLIDDEVARRMAELGNITPAISVEGGRKRTDKRRGEGIFDRILTTMTRLRQRRVLFGLSITATSYNAEEILSDEFVDFFFEKQGALYAWIFHYMPIGRSFALDLMPTPEQRLRMRQRTWQLIRDQHLLLADFWNLGTMSDGCISAGRPGGGYLHVNWSGAVSPCAFVPYSPVNIDEAYASGKTLNDVWANLFFADIRAWQRQYGFHQSRNGRQGNWLVPCPIRDHYREFRQLLIRHEPDPTDENARRALLDEEYRRGLLAYGDALQTLSEPLWQDHYLCPTDMDSNSASRPEK